MTVWRSNLLFSTSKTQKELKETHRPLHNQSQSHIPKTQKELKENKHTWQDND